MTGATQSPFPTTPGAYEPNGGSGFVSKLDSSGASLVYSTYLLTQGPGVEDVAVDGDGDAYVAGTAGPFAPVTPGAPDTSSDTYDAYVVELNPSGTGLVYATFLGGTGNDFGRGIALDDHASAYVVGQTSASDFPVTPSAYDTTYNGATDVFVSKLLVPSNAYVRPRGATPFHVPLVPANRECMAPNSTHGGPLSFDSCSPPQLSSDYATTGTPDSNGLLVRMDAYLNFKVMPGNSATPADDADVGLIAHVNDVFNKDLTDYTGTLEGILALRLTDKDNSSTSGGPGAGTTQGFPFAFDIPCTPDPDERIGSDCTISTTADTLLPGAIKESIRTIWQLGRVRIDDGGADRDGSTTADNTIFATQGLFVP